MHNKWFLCLGINHIDEQGYGNSTGGGNSGETGNTPTEPETTTGPNGKPLVETIEKNDTYSPEGTDNSEKVTYNYNGDGTSAVQDGIVIEDEEGNQFVWIPVGDVKNKDGSTTTMTLGRYTFDTTNGTPTLEQESANYTQTVTVSGYGGNYYQELPSSTDNNVLYI